MLARILTLTWLCQIAGDPSEQQPETFPCQVLGVVFVSQECHDQQSEEPSGKFQCSQCSYSSDVSNDVAIHERTHSGERPFVCSLCQEGFAEEGELWRHQLAVHTEEKPHECEVCGERFSEVLHLARHEQLVHMQGDGLSLFECPQCGRVFTHKGHLNTHLLTHTGERPYACTMCNARFARRSNLKRHVIVRHHRR
ncbi:zinc finger X-chromosomal protein-like isoform X2 [Haemaphysalis longicornis]